MHIIGLALPHKTTTLAANGRLIYLKHMATVVVARWEGEFDDERAAVYGTPAEAQYDIKHGEPAFAAAAIEGD